MIKLGTYLNRYEGLSFEERVRGVKRAGFDFIAFGMAYLTEETPEKVVDLCEKILGGFFFGNEDMGCVVGGACDELIGIFVEELLYHLSCL